MCTRIIRMRFIENGHPSALGIEGIQDDVMDEDNKAAKPRAFTEVNEKDIN
jgi:hypothetical protein